MKIEAQKRLAALHITTAESVYAMSNVYTNYTYRLSFQVNPTDSRVGEHYFKVYNHSSMSAADKVARISFDEPRYIIHKDGHGKQPWILDSSAKKNMMHLLSKNNYSVWKKLIANFNREKYEVSSRRWSWFTKDVQENLKKIQSLDDILILESSENALDIKTYKFILSVLGIYNNNQLKRIHFEDIKFVLLALQKCMPIDKEMPDYSLL